MLTKALLAALVGGLFCVLAQILLDKTRLTPARILVFYVVFGVFLGAVGAFEPLFNLAGAGATLPLVGFGATVARGVREAVDAEGALVESAGRGVWTVGYSIISMIQSMYTGVLKILFADFSAFASIVGATVAYLITPLFAPVAAGLGYMYGCRNPVRRRS